jgi:hypothetical protein
LTSIIPAGDCVPFDEYAAVTENLAFASDKLYTPVDAFRFAVPDPDNLVAV